MFHPRTSHLETQVPAATSEFQTVMAVFLEWTETHLLRTAVVTVADRLTADESQIKLAKTAANFDIWRRF